MQKAKALTRTHLNDPGAILTAAITISGVDELLRAVVIWANCQNAAIHGFVSKRTGARGPKARFLVHAQDATANWVGWR